MSVGWTLAAAVALAAPVQAAPVQGAADRAPSGLTIEERITSDDPGVRAAAVAEVTTAPEQFDPFAYAMVSAALWRDERRLQAAFWFYVFQARSRAWADADRAGSGAAALRASLNDLLGSPINAWLGHDLTAWRAVATRAMAYEARLPLGTTRPDGVSAAQWPALVAKARDDYRAGYAATLGKADPADFAAKRRANGLPSGPLPSPGPALPEAWR